MGSAVASGGFAEVAENGPRFLFGFHRSSGRSSRVVFVGFQGLLRQRQVFSRPHLSNVSQAIVGVSGPIFMSNVPKHHQYFLSPMATRFYGVFHGTTNTFQFLVRVLPVGRFSLYIVYGGRKGVVISHGVGRNGALQSTRQYLSRMVPQYQAIVPLFGFCFLYRVPSYQGLRVRVGSLSVYLPSIQGQGVQRSKHGTSHATVVGSFHRGPVCRVRAVQVSR